MIRESYSTTFKTRVSSNKNNWETVTKNNLHCKTVIKEGQNLTYIKQENLQAEISLTIEKLLHVFLFINGYYCLYRPDYS